jgi:hypothetical protein
MERRRPLRWIASYYLATPLFAGADLLFGANVRAVGLADHPEWRAVWYAGCLGCGVVALVRPGWTSVVGLAESALNLLLLSLSVFLPLLAVADRASQGGMVTGSPFGLDFATNLLMSSMVWVTLFHARMRPAWHGRRPALS